jgi:hypothetical protein
MAALASRRDLLKASAAISVLTVTSAEAQIKRLAVVHSVGWRENTSNNALYQSLAAGLASTGWHIDGSNPDLDYTYRPVRGADRGDGREITKVLDAISGNIDLVIAAGGLVAGRGASNHALRKPFIYIIGANPSSPQDLTGNVGGVNLNSVRQNEFRLAKVLDLAGLPQSAANTILLLQNNNSRNRADEVNDWRALGGYDVPDGNQYFPLFKTGNPDPDIPAAVQSALDYSLTTQNLNNMGIRGIVVSADPFFGRATTLTNAGVSVIVNLLVMKLNSLGFPVVYPLADYRQYNPTGRWDSIGPMLGSTSNPTNPLTAYWKLGVKAGTFLMTNQTQPVSTWMGSDWNR